MRLLAALAVFITHFASPIFAAIPAVPEHMGHQAVVIFFVLSGYVIAYVAAQREKTLLDYAVSRMARIYSVAIPALIITALIDLAMQAGGVKIDSAYQLASWWKYLPLFLTFTTDIWFLTEYAFSNQPYWSLCYEVWYYIAFACIWYLRGWKRIAGFALVVAITGPRLWLLAPLWAGGAVLYHLHRQQRLTASANTARIISVISIVILALIVMFQPDQFLDRQLDNAFGGWMRRNLRFSIFALGDTFTGIIVMANIWAARFAAWPLPAQPIRILAGVSFSLYLLHYPMLEIVQYWGATGVTLFLGALLPTLALGAVIETQKAFLRGGLMRAVAAVRSACG